jgi:hypothetical protein
MNGRMALRFVGALALAAVTAAPGLRASTVRPLNLEQLTARAATIFSGRCLTVRRVHDPDLDAEVTEVIFQVDRVVKGTPGPRRRVRMLEEPGHADSLSGGRALAVRPGDEVVLFLYGENERGLTAPVAMGQGWFDVRADKHGGKLATGPLNNQVLWRGLSAHADARLRAHGLSGSDGRQLALPDLLDAVAELAR